MEESNKFEILKGKWIMLKNGDNKQLLNLNSMSNISTYSSLEGEYLIIFAPNVDIYSRDSENSSAIWNPNFTGGKLCLEYDKKEEWEKDFDILKDLIDH